MVNFTFLIYLFLKRTGRRCESYNEDDDPRRNEEFKQISICCYEIFNSNQITRSFISKRFYFIRLIINISLIYRKACLSYGFCFVFFYFMFCSILLQEGLFHYRLLQRLSRCPSAHKRNGANTNLDKTITRGRTRDLGTPALFFFFFLIFNPPAKYSIFDFFFCTFFTILKNIYFWYCTRFFFTNFCFFRTQIFYRQNFFTRMETKNVFYWYIRRDILLPCFLVVFFHSYCDDFEFCGFLQLFYIYVHLKLIELLVLDSLI